MKPRTIERWPNGGLKHEPGTCTFCDRRYRDEAASSRGVDTAYPGGAPAVDPDRKERTSRPAEGAAGAGR